MSYINKNLMLDEVVVHRTTLHWILFLRPVLFLLLCILVLPSPDVAVLEGFLLLIAIVDGGLKFVHYKTSEFGLTNRRVLLKSGLIRVTSLELYLQKIESIDVDQGIIGRLLGYGTLSVIGTGGSKKKFANVRKPLVFRRQIQSQIPKE